MRYNLLMSQPLDELIAVRKQKLEELKTLGVDPYAFTFDKTLSIKSAREVGDKPATTAGRITALRGHGALTFADIVDETGKIQLLLRRDQLNQLEQEILDRLDLGDIIGVIGQLFTTKAGELTIEVSSLVLLTKSVRPLPSAWHGLKDIEERYRTRYVDLLLNPDVRRVFDLRTKLLTFLRHYLDDLGFVEVETPVLQPIYGGATATPFTTRHKALDQQFYLRISDELYLKRLIVGGYDKVYEVARDFRNEGIDRQHNPEFTMIEFYKAYADYTDLMEITEDMVSTAVHQLHGKKTLTYQGQELDFAVPWPRVTYRDLLLKDTGIDINQVTTEDQLLKELKVKKLKLDLKGVTGYANILDKLYKEYSRPHLVGPLFIIDHPYEAMPLAKRKPDDPSKIASFQLIICGYEIIKAYSELNDPADQRARWEEEKELAKAGFEEAQMLDEDYIRALEIGMPPTAGWGMGVDRLTAILADCASLKDTIIFPTLRPEK